METVSCIRERTLPNGVLGSAPGLSRKDTPLKCQPVDRKDAQAEWNGKKLHGLWVIFLLAYKELILLLA